jgi:hypothetical protein
MQKVSKKPTKGLKAAYKRWRFRQNTRIDYIQRQALKYQGNIYSNSAYRILLSVLFFIFLIYLLYALITNVRSGNWYLAAVSTIVFTGMFYLPAKYLWLNYDQLSYELEVSKSISNLKWRIRYLSKPQGKKNYRSFQAGISELRRNLIGYLDKSEIVSLAVPDFELNRLKKRIDIFSNCVSEALVPIDKLFSNAAERDKEFYGEPPPDDEEFEVYDFGKSYETAQERAMTGEFTDFDLDAMDEFLDHLWSALFDKEVRRYSIFSYKHPVNLLLLSRFFDEWNVKIARCNNCKPIFKKANEDIEAYYRTVSQLEGENRQRKWKLRDDVILVITSVAISTFIQYLLK